MDLGRGVLSVQRKIDMTNLPDDAGKGKGRPNYLVEAAKLAGGYPPAEKLLQRILYWWPKARVTRDGRRWIAKSAVEWCEETGSSVHQHERALARLRQRGVIETRQMIFGGKSITHLRLLKGAGADPRSCDTAGPWSCNTAGPTPCRTAGPHIQGGTTESYSKEVQTGVLAHAPGPGTTDEQKDSGEDESQGENQSNKVSPNDNVKTDTSLIDLENMWRRIVGKEHDTLVPRFTPHQRGQLRQFVERCPKGQARPVLETCLRDWSSFTDQAEKKAGAFKLPECPDVGFLLRYVGVAVNYHREKVKEAKIAAEFQARLKAKASVQTIATPSPSEPVKTKPTKPEYPADDPPATYEEVMEIFGVTPGLFPATSKPAEPRPDNGPSAPKGETSKKMMEELNKDEIDEAMPGISKTKLPADEDQE